jgi:hypothetical protein
VLELLNAVISLHNPKSELFDSVKTVFPTFSKQAIAACAVPGTAHAAIACFEKVGKTVLTESNNSDFGLCSEITALSNSSTGLKNVVSNC